MFGKKLGYYCTLSLKRPESSNNVISIRYDMGVKVTNRTISAARRPEDVMIRVCGVPLSSGLWKYLLSIGLDSANSPRNAGRYSRLLGCRHLLVSRIDFASQNQFLPSNF